jgi:hypothetical protein
VVSLTPIETVGYDLAFFKLPETEDNGVVFTYYTFDTIWPPGWENEWNLVGLHQRSDDPLLLDVRLINVGDDELSLDAFDSRYANGLLSVHPAEFLALIQFFEKRVMDRWRLKAVRSPTSFHLLDTEELTRLHLQPWQIGRKVGDSYTKIGDYYRYTPGENVQSSEKTSLMRLPEWSSRYDADQSVSLTFVTFDRARLIDPEFNPFDTVIVEWPGTMTFDQGALEEFIVLLKQYTYEQMVGGL